MLRRCGFCMAGPPARGGKQPITRGLGMADFLTCTNCRCRSRPIRLQKQRDLIQLRIFWIAFCHSYSLIWWKRLGSPAKGISPMTTADMTQSQFLRGLTVHDVCHDGEPTHEVLIASEFFQLKEVLDRVLAFILLIPLLPLIGFLILAVRLTSRGPGIFRQTRVGKEGRIFMMYKLRSMRIDAEAATGPVWANVGRDPRVTRLGYWLRRLHLDEVPQLINVVRGEMSLVGPRPERPEFVSVLAEQIPGYLTRIAVQPGITGLAQINLPPDTNLDSVRRKLILDCEYIQTAGLLLDLRILVCTLLRTIGLRGGRSVRLMGLQRTVNLPPNTAVISRRVGAELATPRRIATAEGSRSDVEPAIEAVDVTTLGRADQLSANEAAISVAASEL